MKSNCVKIRITAQQAALVLVALLLFPGSGQAQNAQIDQQSRASKQRAAAPNLLTIFVVGDSTANNNANGARGWGDPFVDYFDAEKINVLNRARGGRSSRTFITEGLWDQVLSEMKRGDFVLIQFGHNDAGAINDATRARGSLPGIGEETQEIDNLLTKKHEVVHTYGWYMRKMIADTKAKGATPIVLSLTVRNIWKEGRVERGSGKFGLWASEIAKSQGVTFIDLTTLIANKYEELGEDKVKGLFATDHTHTSPAGAELNASLVVAGLKMLSRKPLNRYLSAKGTAVKKEKYGRPISQSVATRQKKCPNLRPLRGWKMSKLSQEDFHENDCHDLFRTDCRGVVSCRGKRKCLVARRYQRSDGASTGSGCPNLGQG